MSEIKFILFLLHLVLLHLASQVHSVIPFYPIMQLESSQSSCFYHEQKSLHRILKFVQLLVCFGLSFHLLICLSLFSKNLYFLITGYLLFYLIRLFLSHYSYFKNRRYSDNLDALYKICLLNLPLSVLLSFWTFWENCFRSTDNFEEHLYFPIMSLPIREHGPHTDLIECCASPSNTSHIFSVQFFSVHCLSWAVATGYFPRGSVWSVQCSARRC